MKINNLKVGMRLGLGFALVILLTLALGIISIIHINNLSDLTLKLYKHPYTVSTAVLRIHSGMVSMHRFMKDAALAANEAEINSAAEAVANEEKQVLKNFDIVMERFLGEKSQVEKARDMFTGWKPIRDEIISLAKNQDRGKAASILKNRGTEYLQALDSEISGLIEFAEGKADLFVDNAGKSKNQALFITALVILFTIAAGMAASLILTRSITVYLKKAVNMADAMSKGDMRTRLDIKTSDEIGILASALNSSAKGIAKMISEIKESSKILADSSQSLSGVSNQLAGGSEEMTNQSSNVAGSTEQMSAGINTIASAIEQMSVTIQGIASAAEQMSQNMSALASASQDMSVSIQDITHNSKEGARVADDAKLMSENATKTMNDLGEAAKEIGKVTDVIKRIAEQTNLLALNATIEAASAGDAGRGFAVVASEIKELAGQSARAAEDIARRIAGVQKNSEKAVKVITDVSEIINTINNAVRVISDSVEKQRITADEISANISQANTAANNVASSVGEVARGANDIAQNASESAKGANEVAYNIQGLNQAAVDASSSAMQVNKSALAMEKIAGQLQDMVEKFKVN
ncbi:Methyl-accepting chemotaxis protein signailing-domain-containing protein, HAMP domain-containing [Desulfonema limicola]|uniref:Methyl-accepting chemotaxis protein signailing-domain-containing protein, HAMP domain-containing n=1 Tax=Desulfonema limicola TaxID=45656 RepID=A0A975GJH1_9BACT|nr:methyl-accepting chemotaxis protein [Desulfonema limicola]QTA83711.1 Methyl-accepting chemotaxis protein signailing-domain-containing protein, HAMP domain-containing [Desulfonema limicola]